MVRKNIEFNFFFLNFTGDGKWRAPDLQEVIDYLGHPNQSIVAHAAGYIQHLSYQNDDIKRKTRSERI